MTALFDDALRAELLRMAEEDQAARSEVVDRGSMKLDAVRRVETLDRRNTARMREIVSERGWPDQRLVGTDGADAAWLLVQHADDLEFQRRCLDLMEKAAATGLDRWANFAYLTDRIRISEGNPQLYGTQFREQAGKLVPLPIEDEDHVDDRRHEMGLPLLAEYLLHAETMYGVGQEEPKG